MEEQMKTMVEQEKLEQRAREHAAQLAKWVEHTFAYNIWQRLIPMLLQAEQAVIWQVGKEERGSSGDSDTVATSESSGECLVAKGGGVHTCLLNHFSLSSTEAAAKIWRCGREGWFGWNTIKLQNWCRYHLPCEYISDSYRWSSTLNLVCLDRSLLNKTGHFKY